MIDDINIKQRTAGKRKRIPLRQNLQQGFPNKKEGSIISGDPDQTDEKQRDIAANQMAQNIISTREEELLRKLLVERGSE